MLTYSFKSISTICNVIFWQSETFQFRASGNFVFSFKIFLVCFYFYKMLKKNLQSSSAKLKIVSDVSFFRDFLTSYQLNKISLPFFSIAIIFQNPPRKKLTSLLLKAARLSHSRIAVYCCSLAKLVFKGTW